MLTLLQLQQSQKCKKIKLKKHSGTSYINDAFEQNHAYRAPLAVWTKLVEHKNV